MTRETETSGQVDFTDQSKINDEGWICGSVDPAVTQGKSLPPELYLGFRRRNSLGSFYFRAWS